MSGSNCCFLTCIQISQEAGKVVWYSHLFKNFLQFVVIHTVKGFSIVNKAVDVFWNSLAFSMIQQMLTIWSLVHPPFLNPACTSDSSLFMYCWDLTWRILSIVKWVQLCSSLNIFSTAFFVIVKKTDIFQSCSHCWIFQNCWHIEFSTLTASSFSIWNSSAGIPSPPLELCLL